MILLYIAEKTFLPLSFTSLQYKISKRRIKKIALKSILNKRIIMPKEDEYIKFKSYKRKIKSPFIIYAEFEKILVPKDNEKQNLEESCRNQYQKHIACSYGYKLICVDDKFSKPFQIYLGKDAVYNFINSTIEESEYCSDVMIKYFKK